MKRYSVHKDVLEKIRFCENDNIFYGADQEWFSSPLKRAAGCGPVAAAMMYVCIADHTEKPSCAEDWLPLMKEWWKAVTPGMFGLNSVVKFAFGADRFFRQNDLPFFTKTLPLSACKYPPIEQAVDFIKDGLEKNCPVAFLNLGNGGIENLQAWHWVVITALTENTTTAAFSSEKSLLAEIYDEGSVLEIDFVQWYKTAKHFGGLAYFQKEA